jgi:hypothetical protein
MKIFGKFPQIAGTSPGLHFPSVFASTTSQVPGCEALDLG